MTIKTIPKKPIIATITATILLGTILVISNTLTNDVIAQTASPSSPCPADGEVQHWDKIVFQITKDESKTIPKDMLKKTLDLKILDTPEEVVDLEQKVKNAVGVKFGVDPADIKIKIIDVLYQTVTCGLTGPPGADGAKGDPGDPGSLGVSIKYVKLRDDASGNSKGWDPNFVTTNFSIVDADVTENSIITVYVTEPLTPPISFNILSDLACDRIIVISGGFGIFLCDAAIFDEDATLQYTVINPIP